MKQDNGYYKPAVKRSLALLVDDCLYLIGLAW